MYEEPKYTYYRNKRIPIWWSYYLPDEINPYQTMDTLTLERGCLADYWHIHSSNKHPNYRGAEACNFVHEMIRNRFGGAFLTSKFHFTGGRQGERSYHEPDHLVYKNARLGDDEKIHIKNARQYYEDVISFVQSVLREISKNHYQSGNNYNAHDFFPYQTDAEIAESIEREKIRKENTKKLQAELEQYILGDTFFIDIFEFKTVRFNASYSTDDGWFNVNFNFKELTTNIAPENGSVRIVINMPDIYYPCSKNKNPNPPTKVMNIPYCLYFYNKPSEDTNTVIITIPGVKISEPVKQKINLACSQAMEEYNREQEYSRGQEYRRGYHFFLDNNIGTLNLFYKENAGKGTWRMGYSYLSC